MRDRLFAALTRRVRAFEQGAYRAVLDPRALVDASNLMRRTADADGLVPFEVVHLVAWLHWCRYLALPDDGDDLDDLQAAIELFTEIAGIDPQMVPEPVRRYIFGDGDGDDAGNQASYAVDLLRRAMQYDDFAALNRAIELLTAAITATPDDHPYRADRLSNLGFALSVRFDRTGVKADLDEAISVSRQAVAATPDDHPGLAGFLSRLGGALRARFERAGAKADLDEAVSASRQAVTVAADHPDRAGYLHNLGLALQTRFRCAGDGADLDEAVSVSRQAVAEADDHPGRGMFLSSLGFALQTRFERAGAGADLDEAVSVSRQAIATTPDYDPGRAGYLSNLGNVLRVRFERTGAGADLDEAISVSRQAVAAADDDHPERAAMLSNLGVALSVRSERIGADGDLDEAVTLGRQAVAATPDYHADLAGRLSNLGGALRARYERTGARANLDEAITAERQAVAATRDDHPDRARYLSNLGLTLRVRFGSAGAGADLDEAVTVHRLALAATPADHPERAGRLFNLGVALQVRFERAGAEADLDEAVTVHRLALAATPADHPDRARHFSDLGNALQTRFRRTGAEADLDEAVTVLRQALAATRHSHPTRAVRLSNLSLALQTRYVHVEDEADLDEAVGTSRQAVAATPDDHPDRARYLSNLGLALQTQFERSGVEADLDEAVDASRQAVAATPNDHPDRAQCLFSLGLALQTRFERTGDRADLDEALLRWSETHRLAIAPTTTRLTAAEQWARATARWFGPAAAVKAYTAALQLLPLLAWQGISHSDQHHLLQTHAASLGRDGAACAIAAGHPDLAVELLEQGRGVFWSQLRSTRTDLATLQQVAPHLAQQLLDCRATLDQSTLLGAPTDIESGLSGEARMAAARRFDDLVEQVRALEATALFPHPVSFLKPPSADSLLPRAGEDPIVIVNISQWRCDVLILTHKGVIVIELPHLTEKQVLEEANRYLRALQQFERSHHTAADRLVLEMAITTCLQWLWDHIAAPILDTLDHTTPPTGAWPRLWWCTTGALTLMPLHAAGHLYTTNTVHDRVVSSYTPTVRALDRARAQPPSTHQPQILIVSLPNTPGQNELPGAHTERDFLAARFTENRRTILTDAEATRATVLANLAKHRWLHASCHGTQNLANPSAGGLLPYDWNTAGLITVTELSGPDHAGGEFAFLSACKTAIGGVTSLDEAINVAAAMQHAGWRHVIGTLFSVWDDSAASITQHLYPQLQRNGTFDPTTSAEALHHAVHQLRSSQPGRPSTWIPFIHIGP